MTNEPPPLSPSRMPAPWLRLLAVIIVAIALVEVAASISFDLAFQALDGPPPDAMGDPEAEWLDPQTIHDRLRLISFASLGHGIMTGLAMVTVLVLVIRRIERRRLAAGSAVVGLLAMCVPVVLLLLTDLDPEPAAEPLGTRVFMLANAGRVLVAGALLVLAQGHAGHGPLRRPALTLMGLGVVLSCLPLAIQLFASGSGSGFVDSTDRPWWYETIAHVRISGWVELLANLATGVGLWLCNPPDPDEPGSRFDQLAARGLELARTAIVLRVIVAALSVLVVIAGNYTLQKSATALMFSSSPTVIDLPWGLRMAPWLGYVEAALGMMMVLALTTAVLQTRSTLARALVAVGSTLLLASLASSFGLNGMLHAMLLELTEQSSLDRFAEAMRNYAAVNAWLEPAVRGVGLLGLGSVLLGLMRVASRIGRPPPRRPIRLFVIVLAFTGLWLYGRDTVLVGLGAWTLVLVPVILGAAVWALRDLTTYLREVSGALISTPEELSESRDQDEALDPAG